VIRCFSFLSLLLVTFFVTDVKATLSDKDVYDRLNTLRASRFHEILESRAKNIPLALTRNEKTLQFIHNIVANNVSDVVKFIEAENRPPVVKQRISRTCVLIDATSSMQPLMNCVNKTISNLLENVEQITTNSKSGKVLMQFVIYRNYNDGPEKILIPSGWTNNSQELLSFLKEHGNCVGGGVSNMGGDGREAIELALQYVNSSGAIKAPAGASGLGDDDDNSTMATQVIIIGDASYNTMSPQDRKTPRWTTKFPVVTTATSEINELRKKGVPVHVFHVKQAPKAGGAGKISRFEGSSKLQETFETEFRAVATRTSGQYFSLSQSESDENKAEFMRNAAGLILSDVEKDAGKAKLLIEQFNAMVQKLALSSS
jgi:hypothetical protein